jgi:hypothetical protein
MDHCETLGNYDSILTERLVGVKHEMVALLTDSSSPDRR